MVNIKRKRQPCEYLPVFPMRTLVHLKWTIVTIYFLRNSELDLIWNGVAHIYYHCVQTARLRNAASIALTFKECKENKLGTEYSNPLWNFPQLLCFLLLQTMSVLSGAGLDSPNPVDTEA